MRNPEDLGNIPSDVPDFCLFLDLINICFLAGLVKLNETLRDLRGNEQRNCWNKDISLIPLKNVKIELYPTVERMLAGIGRAHRAELSGQRTAAADWRRGAGA